MYKIYFVEIKIPLPSLHKITITIKKRNKMGKLNNLLKKYELLIN